jgi:hypothetical protein
MSTAVPVSTRTSRPDLTSVRARIVAALAVVLLVVVCALVLVPVASTTAAGPRLDTSAAAEQFVADAHMNACPGGIPTVTCSAASAGWACRWAGGAVEIARTADRAPAMAC